MVNTYVRHWPSEVPLRLYTEGFDCHVASVQAVDLDAAAPWLKPWKADRSKAQRGNGAAKYNYRTDAVRFSHKVAALGAAANDDVDVLIWMDADTVTHTDVTVDWLESLFPETAEIAWLDRAKKYPECGFLMSRLPAMRPIIWEIVAAYQTGAIFRYPETHDSYVIQQVVEAAVRRGEIAVASLSGEGRNYGHPLVNSRVAECLDHLKGGRKELGKSKPTDLRKPRPEPYWRWS